MSGYQRAIKFAFDQKFGEVLEAEQVFDTKKNSFEVRKQFHRSEIEPYCCECGQRLNISASKYDRLHFKHEAFHFACLLTDGNLSPQEAKLLAGFHRAKESDRHKELKHKIADRLAGVPGVIPESIAVDNRFIILGNEKRRPDVYCTYKDKNLVFEIQLSDLSLRYIYGRHEFYRKHGYYLIWILDNFDVRNQSTMERDIKYLSEHQNFFKLDEKCEEFKLNCRYKFPYLTNANKLQTKWLETSVSLDEIQFDPNSCQAYYYDFAGCRKQREDEQQNVVTRIREKEAKEQLRIAHMNVQNVIDTIRLCRNNKWGNYGPIAETLSVFTNVELSILSSKLNVVSKESPRKPAINYWLATASQDDVGLIGFLLSQPGFFLDVNCRDENSTTALQEIYNNDKLSAKDYWVKKLLICGYRFGTSDKQYLEQMAIKTQKPTNEVLNYSLCSQLADRSLVKIFFEHISTIHCIESAKRNSIVGFNYKHGQWAAFAINAIQYYSQHWEYLERAFQFFGVWDTITQADRKGTFHKKLTDLYDHFPSQDYGIDPVIQELYPEIA